MHITIELESLDDLINLIGLARLVEPKEQKVKEEIVYESPASKDCSVANFAKTFDIPLRDEKKSDLDEKLDKIRKDRRVRFFSCPIESLGLRKHAENSLKSSGITHIKHLAMIPESQIKEFPYVGPLSLHKIRSAFKSNGVALRNDSQ